METILSRIKQIAQNEGLGISVMEGEIGASKGVLSRAIKNGTDIQSKWIQKIVEIFPRYSERWLLTGEGNMMKENPVNVKKASKLDGMTDEEIFEFLAEETKKQVLEMIEEGKYIPMSIYEKMLKDKERDLVHKEQEIWELKRQLNDKKEVRTK